MPDEYVGRQEFDNWRQDQKDRFEGVDRRVDRLATVEALTNETGHLRQYVDAQNRALREHVDNADEGLAGDIKEIKERGQMTRGQLIAVLCAVGGVIATVVAAYISTKGIK